MRMCPICQIENKIIKTILGRDEYTKCTKCGLFYTHKDVDFSTFENYYDNGRDPDKNYQDDYINNESEHNRNEALARQFQIVSDEPWLNKNLLEIGSSSGYLLKSARQLGARVQGIEISWAASEHANNVLGVPTICANWEIYDLEYDRFKSRFDIVCTSHVIEHFVFPYDAIRKISEVLRLGGCWITQHPDASVFPGVKFHVRDNVPDEHLQIFDKDTILLITDKVGFKRVYYQPEEPGQSVSVFRKIRNP
jgi:SAM-dependent methyltransferase